MAEHNGKPQPVAKVREYPITAAIWRNHSEKGVFYNFTLDRSYKDESGTYQNTSSFGRVDALLIEKVVGRVFLVINKLRAADRATNQADAEHDDVQF